MKTTKDSIKRINKQLYELGKKYYPSIPLNEIDGILVKEGLTMIQEDNTKWNGWLVGSKGECTFELGLTSTVNECGMYEIIKKYLRMSWYRMESGNYEIVAYMT